MKTVALYTDEEFAAKWPPLIVDGSYRGSAWSVVREAAPCGDDLVDTGRWRVGNISIFNSPSSNPLDEVNRLIDSLSKIREFIVSDGKVRP